jgi:hypothetical protein
MSAAEIQRLAKFFGNFFRFFFSPEVTHLQLTHFGHLYSENFLSKEFYLIYNIYIIYKIIIIITNYPFPPIMSSIFPTSSHPFRNRKPQMSEVSN